MNLKYDHLCKFPGRVVRPAIKPEFLHGGGRIQFHVQFIRARKVLLRYVKTSMIMYKGSYQKSVSSIGHRFINVQSFFIELAEFNSMSRVIGLKKPPPPQRRGLRQL